MKARVDLRTVRSGEGASDTVGVVLTSGVTTRFFLYFSTRHSAVRSVDLLHARGFEAETGLGWDDPFYNTIARCQLADGDLADTDRQMRELTTSLGGDYGGYDQRPEPSRPAVS
jgi:hypothetical protein